jgi:hypothetical protein
VMNLVSLLIAPLVVRYADKTVARITIAALAAALLAVMIWYSKSRRVELFAGEGGPDAQAEPRPGVPPGSETVPEAREVSDIVADAAKRSSP